MYLIPETFNAALLKKVYKIIVIIKKAYKIGILEKNFLLFRIYR